MHAPDLTFAIPTYRLRDVGATVEAYDEHFRSNGHAARIVVFDDSSLAGYDKYHGTLAETRTQNPLSHVGPREKEAFLAYVNGRLRNRTLESVVKNLFRPSYGGNRNFTLMYTLGEFLVSSDDDMRPYALLEDSPESLVGDEVARGRLFRAGAGGYASKSYDLLRAFLEVLGRPAGQAPRNFAQGELLEDSTTDLETNMTRVFARVRAREHAPAAAGRGPADERRQDGADVPVGDRAQFPNGEFEVLVMDGRRVSTVAVHRRRPAPADEASGAAADVANAGDLAGDAAPTVRGTPAADARPPSVERRLPLRADTLPPHVERRIPLRPARDPGPADHPSAAPMQIVAPSGPSLQP